MSLVRFEIRNEFGLGGAELYGEAKKDDPKALLDGVAVAGLVGILRQLGDLAQFASEVFHDLQEQVMATASHSKKLMVRVQNIEATLPRLEKAVLSQTSHIHFVYTAGSDWHASIRDEQNHLANSDLPRFIMDSYEGCRDPPSLHLLDKFDPGGPGACLKRYSDPTYFKRALVSTDSENVDKIQREKNAHKSKKIGERQKNLKHPLTKTAAELSDRMQFGSRRICQKNSNAEIISTSDMRSRSDLGDTSFNSRSDYIECVFETVSSMALKNQEQNGLPASRLKKQSYDTCYSVPSNEPNGGVDSVLQHECLQEECTVDASYVTWDEKTEIVKPTSQESKNGIDVHGNASELMHEDSDLGEFEREANNLSNVDRDDSIHDDANLMESLSDGNLFDDVGSETDRYMDALNTIASETETDTEVQTKGDVDLRPANPGNKVIESTNHSSASSDFEPCVTSYDTSHKPMSQNVPDTVSSEDLVREHSPGVISPSPKPNHSVGATSSGNTDLLEVSKANSSGTVMRKPASSIFNIPNLQPTLSEKIVSSLCDPEESAAKILEKPSIQIWTNGGLLGLAPSKPPDVMLNMANQSLALDPKRDEHCLSGYTHSNGPEKKLEASVKDSELGENNQRLEGETRSPDTISSNDLPRNQLVKSMRNGVHDIDHSECSTSSQDQQDTCKTKNNPSCSNSFNSTHGHGLTDTNFMVLGAKLPIILGIGGQSGTPKQEIKKTPFDMLLPSHRLHVNGLGREVSPAHGDMSQTTNLVKTDFTKSQEPSYTDKKGLSRTMSLELNHNEHLEDGFPVNSSSPPLEHMKISFHPTDGVGTPKLKLMFHDGHSFRDSIGDATYPSFQLLPEPALPLKDSNFESDDDAFSGSQYMSDELLSQLSESNSERWTSSGTPGSDDNEIYDALRRVSSNESILSSSEIEGLSHHSIYPDCDFENPIKGNNPVPRDYDSPVDLTSEKDSDLVLQCADEAKPPAPPIPPQQWCVKKPEFDLQGDKQGSLFDLQEDKQGSLCAVSNNKSQLQAPSCTVSQQPTPLAPNQLQFKDIAASSLKTKEEQQLAGSKEADQDSNDKQMEKKEDLLHQIRTRSMNLRRTIPAKPTLTPSPTTNLKVTAILEKANAIRQAFVGSDDDEDGDNWSDG